MQYHCLLFQLFSHYKFIFRFAIYGKTISFIHIGVSHKIFGFDSDFFIRISLYKVKPAFGRILANTR